MSENQPSSLMEYVNQACAAIMGQRDQVIADVLTRLNVPFTGAGKRCRIEIDSQTKVETLFVDDQPRIIWYPPTQEMRQVNERYIYTVSQPYRLV